MVLTEIYPAREEPIEGVTSRLIYDQVAPGVEKRLISKQDAVEYVETHDTDVLVVLGAGDLDNMVPRMTEVLKAKYNL